MTITPITKEAPVCFGVMCDKHGQCARYQAINGATYQPRIGTCSEDGKERPLFVPVEAA